MYRPDFLISRKFLFVLSFTIEVTFLLDQKQTINCSTFLFWDFLTTTVSRVWWHYHLWQLILLVKTIIEMETFFSSLRAQEQMFVEQRYYFLFERVASDTQGQAKQGFKSSPTCEESRLQSAVYLPPVGFNSFQSFRVQICS